MARLTPEERQQRTAEARRRAWKKYDQTPRGKYQMHKKSARRRGVAFYLTFEQWWEIWTVSGQWDRRGNTSIGYVMSRYGDTGPYAVDNVFIQLHTANVGDRNRHVAASRRRRIRFTPDDDWRHVHEGAPD